MVDGINTDNVTAWLKDHVPEVIGEVRYSLLPGGHSNLTYRCEDDAGNCYVLRRPPLGHVLESAHDMGREHRIIDALINSDVPVPVNYGLCTDPTVNGADFFVMQFVEGPVLDNYAAALLAPEAERRSIGLRVIDILCDLHTTDMDAVGLGDLGRKESYLTRQLKRWTKQWEATRTYPIPEMEESCKILTETMPEQVGAAIVHGDYRLGNMIVGKGDVKAVLDWELCTLGDPLADVGYLFNNWLSPEEAEHEPNRDIFPTAVGGYPARDELGAIYTERTGRDLTHIDYYRAFSHWRMAAIGQGVYKRYQEGAMGAEKQMDLQGKFESVAHRARQALSLLQK
jgi:aminoglycoside phosphotransferase (APT) family kinase protein